MFPPVFLPDKFMQHTVLGYAPLPFDGRDRAEDIVYRRKPCVLERVSVLAEHGRQTRHQDIDLIRQKSIDRERSMYGSRRGPFGGTSALATER